jgi:hypothetical protein
MRTFGQEKARTLVRAYKKNLLLFVFTVNPKIVNGVHMRLHFTD